MLQETGMSLDPNIPLFCREENPMTVFDPTNTRPSFLPMATVYVILIRASSDLCGLLQRRHLRVSSGRQPLHESKISRCRTGHTLAVTTHAPSTRRNKADGKPVAACL
jgi:hypothetical protein